MKGHSLGEAVRRLRNALGNAADSDTSLLDRFATTRDPAAFAGLVARYGPLVLGICRRAVGDPHLAEDLFQAVFMVLARKAGSIRKRDAVGSWLYGVAFRLGRKTAHREHQQPGSLNETDPPIAEATSSPEHAAWNELLAALDQELQRLPDRLRAPILLCYYDGCTQDEAARRLGWSFGTLRRRIEQGRDLLRIRLTARGATLGAGLLATVFATRGARAAVGSNLITRTIDAAEIFASGGQLTGPAVKFAEEGVRMLGMSKIKASVALAVLVGGLAVGSGTLFGVGQDRPDEKPPTPIAHAPGSPETPLPSGVVFRRIGQPFRHGSEIINVLVTADGKSILTQGYQTVRIWDAATGQEQGILDLPDDGLGFWTASLTPDGKTLITTRHNGTAQIWDIAGRKMTRTFRLAAPPFDVNGAKCVHSPDGKAMAVVTDDGSIRVCDVDAGKEMDQLRSHSDDVTAAVFTPDSKQIAFATKKSTGVRFWDVATGTPVDGRVPPGGQGAKNLVFAPDGKALAAARVVEDRPGEQPKTAIDLVSFGQGRFGNSSLGGNSEAERLMIFSPDGRHLLVPDRTSEGRILTQWNLANGRANRQFQVSDNSITAMAFTSDGATFITATSGLRFWDWKTGDERRRESGDLRDHHYALTPDGEAIVESDGSASVHIWNADTRKEMRRFEAPRPSAGAIVSLGMIAISRDGKLLAAHGEIASADGVEVADAGAHIWFWDGATSKLLYRLDSVPQAALSLMLSADGRALIFLGGDQKSEVWVTATGRRVENDAERNAIVESAKKSLESPSSATVSIWPGEIAQRSQPVARIATPDHKTWAEARAGANPSILILDGIPGRELKRFTGLHAPVTWLAFSPDGKRLYAASADTTVLAWDLGDLPSR